MLDDPARGKLPARLAHRGDRVGDVEVIPAGIHGARGELVRDILDDQGSGRGRRCPSYMLDGELSWMLRLDLIEAVFEAKRVADLARSAAFNGEHEDAR
jgi:hypothetical protein